MQVHIKFKTHDEKRWSFMTSGGGSAYLRIHAARIKDWETAQRIIDENAPDNPEFSWKIVPAIR